MASAKTIATYKKWFKDQGWKPFDFQLEMLEKYSAGYSGLLNAPTGSGKTYALWLPVLMEWLSRKSKPKKNIGLQAIWITPVKALAKDIQKAMQRACSDLGIDWEIAVRTGDTPLSERQKQIRKTPQCLITTPESMHLLLATKGYPKLFSTLKVIVADEWHELLGTKRGVQVELALSRLKALSPKLKIWGVSATIGNLEEALYVLLGEDIHETQYALVQSQVEKQIVVETIIPEEIENYPWAGHLGIKLLPRLLPIIHAGKSTLIFTNTRSQAEIWYQRILQEDPSLAGLMGLHHGSLGMELRTWVEDALHEGTLKVVVCTSSLDLGVDLRPVETVIQIGSPRGVSRFLQRAGRSGHQPGAISKIYFLPTHSMELVEAAALRTAIDEGKIEKRIPLVRSFDVLVQYLVTLAVSEGFDKDQVYKEIANTHAFNTINEDEFGQVMSFITTGGISLKAYNEFSKVIFEDGRYKVTDRRMAMRHRLSIGTIVSDAVMRIKFMSGGFIGTIEEYFIARLKKGDVFSFAGRNLEYIMVKDMDVLVKKSNKQKTIVPQWLGGKMNLSSQMSEMIRRKLNSVIDGTAEEEEMKKLEPLFEKQKVLSIIPGEHQFLIEKLESKEGFHLFFFTFEGRYVNEGLAALLGHRFSKIEPNTFSIAMNDYGFELLSDKKVNIEEALKTDIFSAQNLLTDIQGGLNATEMARRKFRNIANIAGLVFQGFPGKQLKNKHLQASSRLFFEVFRDLEPNHLLLKQAYDEVLNDQLDETRLRQMLDRIHNQEIIVINLTKPTPFCFPIMVERFREKSTGEALQDRVKRMIKAMEAS